MNKRTQLIYTIAKEVHQIEASFRVYRTLEEGLDKFVQSAEDTWLFSAKVHRSKLAAYNTHVRYDDTVLVYRRPVKWKKIPAAQLHCWLTNRLHKITEEALRSRSKDSVQLRGIVTGEERKKAHNFTGTRAHLHYIEKLLADTVEKDLGKKVVCDSSNEGGP